MWWCHVNIWRMAYKANWYLPIHPNVSPLKLCCVQFTIVFFFYKSGASLSDLRPPVRTTVLCWGTSSVQPLTSPELSSRRQGSRAKISHRKYPPSSSPRWMTILICNVIYVYASSMHKILHTTNKSYHYCRQYCIQQINQYKIVWPGHCQKLDVT